MWEGTDDSNIETASGSDLCDVQAAAVDAVTGTVYVLVRESLWAFPRNGESTKLALLDLPDVEGFFTAGTGSRNPSVVSAGHMLLVDRNKLVIINLNTQMSRTVDGQWCLCALDCNTVYLVDANGTVFRAGVGLADESFPDDLTQVCTFEGTHETLDGNQLFHSDEWLNSRRGEASMRLRDSGSVASCICAFDQSKLLVCKGHGLFFFSSADFDKPREIFSNTRSTEGLAYPAAIYAMGTTAFVQCPDGVRKIQSLRGPSSLVLPASKMIFDTDSGSPEPYPQDFIGIDDQYIYFLVERDYYTGMALRRWPHGCHNA